jgi:uncharacterized protein (TIGR00255 family)
MTGFGRGEAVSRSRAFTVETQSVNHRFLEVRCRLPKRLAGLELRIQRLIQDRFSRGHFEVVVQDTDLDGRARTLKVDLALARQYVDALRSLQAELGLPGTVTMELLAGQRDLIAVEESTESLDAYWADLAPGIEAALGALTEMRRREGAAIVAALHKHLGEIEATVAGIVQRAPALVQAQQERLRERVVELMDGRLPDPARLEQEVALLAERSDVTEECDRLKSHLAQFRLALTQPGPQGRRLDFLLQEINREANTTASKSLDAALTHEVVGLKMAIERLREQVQNLE